MVSAPLTGDHRSPDVAAMVFNRLFLGRVVSVDQSRPLTLLRNKWSFADS